MPRIKYGAGNVAGDAMNVNLFDWIINQMNGELTLELKLPAKNSSGLLTHAKMNRTILTS